MTVGDLIYILQTESDNYHDEVVLKVGEDETGKGLYVTKFIIKQQEDKNFKFLSIEKPNFIKENIISLEEKERILSKVIDEEIKERQKYEKDNKKIDEYKKDLEEYYGKHN